MIVSKSPVDTGLLSLYSGSSNLSAKRCDGTLLELTVNLMVVMSGGTCGHASAAVNVVIVDTTTQRSMCKLAARIGAANPVVREAIHIGIVRQWTGDTDVETQLEN